MTKINDFTHKLNNFPPPSPIRKGTKGVGKDRKRSSLNINKVISQNLPVNSQESRTSKAPWFLEQQKQIPTSSQECKEEREEEESDEDEFSDEFDTAQFFDECSDDEEPITSLPQKEENKPMEEIPSCQVTHWKHVIYNLLVENHNESKRFNFCVPYSLRFLNDNKDLIERRGFRFDVSQNPQRKLAELWAQHEKRKKLEDTNLSPVFKDDLYKFYLRSCLDLLAKYFVKHDKYTFLYDDIPLFVPNGSLDEALTRIKRISARSRKASKGLQLPTKPKAKKHTSRRATVNTISKHQLKLN